MSAQGHTVTDDEGLRRILSETKTWAVVGCSPDPSRKSNEVAAFLLERGYHIIPVHPTEAEILGQTCYPDLASIPQPVDVVQLFRRPEQVGPHVEEAIAIGARYVWMQLGIANEEAAARAHEAGIDVVMDHCAKIETKRLLS